MLPYWFVPLDIGSNKLGFLFAVFRVFVYEEATRGSAVGFLEEVAGVVAKGVVA